MTEIQAALTALLPSKRKHTPSGWISFNAVCCHNKGERRDTRQRGGILINPNGGFQYHCFNCNFKAGWTPGNLLTKNTKSLFQWLGMSDTELNKLSLLALQLKENIVPEKKAISFEVQERKLPDNCLPISTWIEQGCTDPNFVEVLLYIKDRGFNFEDYPWHWSDSNGYTNRVIIPFYFQEKIVGWTARKVVEGKPKYLTDSQPGYVFNIDNQKYDKAYTIVVEGQFDAIAIDGVAIMHNEPNETQCARINGLGKEVIVVPDKDKPGAKLLHSALENHWSVSLPPWDDDIKDVADAVKKYGKLYTLFTILHYKETNEIKIQLLKKKLESLNE